MNRKYFSPIIILFCLCSFTNGQTDININDYSTLQTLRNNWYLVQEFSEITENTTPEKAFNNAMKKAYRRALEHQGIEITATTLDIREDVTNNDIFISLSTQLTKGIIIEKKILKREKQIIDNKFYVIVEVKLFIGKQKGSPDPYFNIKATINKETFINGENMELDITVSQDSYIYVFNICSDEKVYQIFPNKYNKDNWLQSGESLHLPTENDKKRTISFPVTLLPGKDKDAEIIKVLACKKKLNFIGFSEDQTYNTYRSTLESFLKTLIKIKRGDIAESDICYTIFSK